jgi:hypothetical protein
MATPDIAPAVALEPKTKLTGKILKTTLAGALVDIGQTYPVSSTSHNSARMKSTKWKML